MTVLDVYEAILIEMRKEKSPHLHPVSFNYYLNLAVDLFVEDILMTLESNARSLDYLKFLKQEAVVTDIQNPKSAIATISLPTDYRNIQSVYVTYKTVKPNLSCYKVKDIFSIDCKRLDADDKAAIIADEYLKPKFSRPYYEIKKIKGTETNVGIPSTEMNIYVGNHKESFEIIEVIVNYISSPKRYKLTPKQIKKEEPSENIQFDDATTRKIIARLLEKLMEQVSDQRIQTVTQINTARPLPENLTNLK